MELGEPDIELGTPTITLGHPVVRMAGGQSAVGYSSSPAISLPAPRVILGDAKVRVKSAF